MQGERGNFARAFKYAGAQSMLVSLWKDASLETVDFMEHFDGHLKSGKTRVQALRLTRSEIKAAHPVPSLWAPFILHEKARLVHERY